MIMESIMVALMMVSYDRDLHSNKNRILKWNEAFPLTNGKWIYEKTWIYDYYMIERFIIIIIICVSCIHLFSCFVSKQFWVEQLMHSYSRVQIRQHFEKERRLKQILLWNKKQQTYIVLFCFWSWFFFNFCEIVLVLCLFRSFASNWWF